MGHVLVDLGAVPGSVTAVVPAQNPQPPPGEGEEFGEASPVGLVVILLLGLATVLLIVSMTKRLRRLPASFDEPGERADGRSGRGRDEPSGTAAGDAGEQRG